MMSCTFPTSKQYFSYYSISVSEVGKTIHFRDITSTEMNAKFLIMQFNEILLSFLKRHAIALLAFQPVLFLCLRC